VERDPTELVGWQDDMAEALAHRKELLDNWC
jgi:hypothetical protein